MTPMLSVDLDAIARNWRKLRDLVSPASCAAVVKADAYGLGAARVAPALAAPGCRLFFVAVSDEAEALAQPLAPWTGQVQLAVLGGLMAGAEADFVRAGWWPVLNDLGQIERWQAAARREGHALPAMIHLDTGMRRLGLPPAEAERLIAEPSRLHGIDLRAWVSHLACADEPGHPLNQVQPARFKALLAGLPRAPASLAASAGILLDPALRCHLVRPGIALYGGDPVPGKPSKMAAVVRLEAPILQLRVLDEETSVGYGASRVLPAGTRVATIGCGYADGYRRGFSNSGTAWLHGVRIPQVGRVSMDLTLFDVTALPEAAVKPGDRVLLVGGGTSLEERAAEAGTINHELLTGLGGRCRRVYGGGP